MTAALRVPVVRVRDPGHALPAYQSDGAAGLDLTADVDAVAIAPGERALVPSGIAVAIPRGYEGQVRPRSGLAHESGLTVLNAPGTIDSDYRGEIQVLLVNLGRETVHVRRGDRIAQLVVAPVARIAWDAVATLAPSERGADGFGSTGVR